MPISRSELTVDFGPIASDAPEDTPISFTVRNERTGESWSEGLFRCPLDESALNDIRWYLEDYCQWPFGPFRDRAQRIEAQLEGYGRALFDALFYARKPGRIYEHFLNQPADVRTLTLVSDAPRVMRLPWELLAESTGPLFTKRPPISVRRRVRLEHGPAVRRFDLPLRVLFVRARPEGTGFVNPRSVARGVLDALEKLGSAVEVDFLRPPTLAALDDALRQADNPYHIVHFDGHGVYHARTGLGQLALEHDDCSADYVDANRLGALLNECGVPLVILNACQSAQGDQSNPFSSIATRLLEAGVGGVLSMSHAVLVVTAARFVATFYDTLVQGRTVGRATDEARRALVRDTRRHTIFRRPDAPEEVVELHDWYLPVLYQQRQDAAPFADAEVVREAAPTPMPKALVDPRVPGGLPPDPLHGFHGRERELLRLERLFREHRVVVLHGFGGMGKTALAAEAGRWFHRTGRFPGGAAFVSFEQGGSLDQLCSWVAQAVSGDPDYLLHKEDPVAAVADLLRREPALVIVDNFESVIGPDPLMPPEELKEVLDAVWTWASPASRNTHHATRFLITTRDTTFNDPRFAPSRRCAHVPLGGLATPDALALAAAVLDDHGIDRAAIPRQALVDLMGYLGGHPLSLTLVLPHLREHTPAELTARFEELLPGFTQGEAAARNESLAVSLEFSLRRLGEATRKALPDLAVFQGGCLEAMMLLITGMSPDLWEKAKTELAQAALVSIDGTIELGAQLPDGTQYNGHFVRFHPTLAPYLATRLDDERRAALEERYWQEYYATAKELYHADTQHPHQARAVALRELPNLRRALDLTVEGGAVAEAVDFATSIAMFLDVFGRWRERDAMMEKVASLQVASGEGLTKAEYLLLSRRGDTLLQQGRAAEAERVFRGLLERLESEAAYDADYNRAMTLWRLGRCLAAQGRPAQAIGVHERALAEFERIANERESESAKRMAGAVHTDLADQYRKLGQFDKAEKEYKAALVIDEELGDLRGKGIDLGQLGTLALLRGELGRAHERYTEALETFCALGEPQMEAVAWHQLGMVAEEAAEWDEAERCYRESLKIKEAHNDLPGVARTCNQLAIVAKGAGRPADAERWYLRAIEVMEQLGAQRELAATLNNLAGLYLSQGRLGEAARYARRAVETVEQHNIQTEVWKMYNLLARIAEARGRAEEAARWRRKEQESYAAYAGAAHQLPGWAPQFIAAVAAAAQGDEGAMQDVKEILPRLEEAGWNSLCNAVRRILSGESDFEKLRTGLDREDAYTVRTILARLSEPALSEVEGEAPTPSPSPARGGGAGRAAGGEGAEGALAQLRQQWAPVIEAVVAVAQAGAPVPADLDTFLDQIGATDDWRALVAVLRRVLDGERDPEILLAGLDPTDTLIAGEVLRGLGVEAPTPPAQRASPPPQGEGAMSLDDLLQMVAAASAGQAPPGLGEQLHALTHQLSRDPDAPTEIQTLGRALNRVLSGDRDPDLSALPPELAAAVRRLLEAI